MTVVSGPSGSDIVDSARDYLGYPYVYGDEGTYGFDCSGFVKTVYARHGYTLPRTSRSQSKVGEPVSFDEALRQTIAWERAYPPDPLDPKMFDYEAEDARLAGEGG